MGVAISMNRFLAISCVILNSLILSFSSPIAAQQNSYYCESALAVKQRLEQKYNLKVAYANGWNISKYYFERPPSNRNIEYVYQLDGSGAESVFNSPVLLKSIAKEVIQGCNSVGIVGFGTFRGGRDQVPGKYFGLLSDGRIELFPCDFSSKERTHWGKRWCYD
ncbi:MAG TPA: hypothetical protein V6D19_19050 [Stenomitos sp.]